MTCTGGDNQMPNCSALTPMLTPSHVAGPAAEADENAHTGEWSE
jgi:hypothetical protein